jgi:hypothetical protein
VGAEVSLGFHALTLLISDLDMVQSRDASAEGKRAERPGEEAQAIGPQGSGGALAYHARVCEQTLPLGRHAETLVDEIIKKRLPACVLVGLYAIVVITLPPYLWIDALADIDIEPEVIAEARGPGESGLHFGKGTGPPQALKVSEDTCAIETFHDQSEGIDIAGKH